MTDSAKQKVHPDFLGPADVTLVSADGTAFHIESSQLARASGWFRTLFTLPQSAPQKRATRQEKITVSEDTLTLDVLLSLCSFAPCLSKLANLAELERCLVAAEKYEMLGATEVLVLLLHTPEMQRDAVHLYALADRYGQVAVAAGALTRLLTLSLDFGTIPHVDLGQLKRISAARQARVEKFTSLFDPALFVRADLMSLLGGHFHPFSRERSDYCTRNSNHRTSTGNAWPTLALTLQAAFIKHPSVKALDSNEQVKAQIVVAEAVKCSRPECQLQQYEWKDIRRRLLQAMDS